MPCSKTPLHFFKGTVIISKICILQHTRLGKEALRAYLVNDLKVKKITIKIINKFVRL